MSNPFFPKIIVLNHIKASDSIKNYSFQSVIDNLCIEPDWKVIDKSANYLVFEYKSNPQHNDFTICMYDGEGDLALVFHSHSDKTILEKLSAFIKSV